jgi:hypothetical protein
VPHALRRTWLALALAALAVVVVGLASGRDFVRDVFATCPGSLVLLPLRVAPVNAGSLAPVFFDSAEPAVPGKASSGTLALRYDHQKKASGRAAPRYANVRVVWTALGSDGRACTCGTVPLSLSAETPFDLQLYAIGRTDAFVVKSHAWDARHGRGSDVRAVFARHMGSSRQLQRDRIFAMRHSPFFIALVGLGALGVGLVRVRRATAYALRIHTWTEGLLTPAGLIEDEGGRALGRLEEARGRGMRPGPLLVAPGALSGAQLYRDMPIVARRSVAEGTHARWVSATMLRLRDARALAVLSTGCTLLAFGARLLAV